MSVKQVIVCDECGAERREANHWFTALRFRAGWVFLPLGNIEVENPKDRFDVCGQKCATDAFQRLLETGTVVR